MGISHLLPPSVVEVVDVVLVDEVVVVVVDDVLVVVVDVDELVVLVLVDDVVVVVVVDVVPKTVSWAILHVFFTASKPAQAASMKSAELIKRRNPRMQPMTKSNPIITTSSTPTMEMIWIESL